MSNVDQKDSDFPVKVSVVIATYNRAGFLKGALKSVFDQTFKSYELIVVDDGSTDDTAGIIKSFPQAKYIYSAHKGASAARNAGILEAKGELIAFLDDDDEWLDDKLQVQARFMDLNPDVSFVCSQALIMDEKGSCFKKWSKGMHNKETFRSLFIENFITFSSVVARKRALLEAGLFDTNIILCEDYELLLRLALKGKFKYLDFPLIRYREHRENIHTQQLDLKLKHVNYIWNKTEKSFKFSLFERRLSRSRRYHLMAKQFYRFGFFFKAFRCYLTAIYYIPFIGFYFWPKEAEKSRFSLPYRLIKPYALLFNSLLKGLRFQGKGI